MRTIRHLETIVYSLPVLPIYRDALATGRTKVGEETRHHGGYALTTVT